MEKFNSIKKILSIGIFFSIAIVFCQAQEKNTYVTNTGEKADFGKITAEDYTSEIRENIKRLYHDKIGLFVHFGPYAVLGGEWQGKPGAAEWIMRRSKIAIPVYEQEAAAKFKPTRFNAEEWVDVAKKGGMGFMVVTSKHHDGFAMYQSEHPYNIYDFAGFNRDLMGELAGACKKSDIGLGFYYSQSQDWHEEGGVGNDWDFPGKKINNPALFDHYFDEKVVPQVTELATGYDDLFMVWFDTPAALKDEHCEELLSIIRKNQPGALVNSRLGNGYGHFDVSLDFGTTPSVNKATWLPDLKIPWQTHGTVARSWGYVKRYSDNDFSKEHGKYIYTFCKIVSHGGVYLLNVSPGPDGTIPKNQVNSIAAIGDWLKINGESIYDADPSPFKFPPYAITSKPGKIYVHLQKSETKETIVLEGLLTKVKKAQCLTSSGKEKIKFNQQNEHLSFSVPEALVQKHVTVIELELADEVAKIADETLQQKEDGTINLPVARCEFGIMRIGYNYEREVTHRWGENKKQELIWTVKVNKPMGKYELVCEQTADEALVYSVEVNGQSAQVKGTGSKEMTFKQAEGIISIDQAGTYTITARPVSTTHYTSKFELKGLKLIPID
ncbi:MAG: alpha-L-fucosidase [Bacteroidota bacterium]